MKYKAYCCYARGALHIKKKLPCEDYAVCYDAKGCAIAIVSDGHGHSLAFRASDGARMACEGTLDILKQYIENSEIIRTIENSKEQFFFNLQGLILRTWLDRVSLDYTTNPFSDTEINALSEDNKEYLSRNTDSYIKVYGCTLIAAYVTPSFWFCLQIGDGTCTVSYEDGISLQPLPEGAGQIANITNSLCQPDAMKKFVHFFEKKTPLGVFVASDGVDESCKPLATSLQLPNFYREISEPFFHKEQNAGERLKSRLERLTEEGCGDDVSVAAAISVETFLAKPKPSPNQLQSLLEKMSIEVEGKRASIQNNINALRQAEEEYKRGLKEFEDKIERIKRIMGENKKELQKILNEKKVIELQLNVKPRATQKS